MSLPEGRLDLFFARLRVAMSGVLSPLRRSVSLEGDAIDSVLDDESTETIRVSCPTILDGVGQLTLAGDFDFTLTPSQARNAIIRRTGAVLIDRDLIFPRPKNDKASYKRIVRVDTTDVGQQIVGVGSGVTVAIPPGCCLEVLFTPDGAFAANTGAPVLDRAIDPHWLFAVDFSLLDLGAHTSLDFTDQTAAQGTNLGLSLARTTAATVQTSVHTVDTGVPVNGARIGSLNGRTKIGLVIEPSRVNAFAPFARAVNFFSSAPSDADETHYPQPGTATLAAAPGPDGQNFATSVAVTAGSVFSDFGSTGTVAHRGKYGPGVEVSAFNSLPLTMSAWVKSSSVQHLTWTSRAPWDQHAHPYPVVEDVTAAGGLWQRIILTRPANGFYQFANFANGTVLNTQGSAVGGLAINTLLDLVQLEQDPWGAEVILTADGVAGGDRLSYAEGADLAAAGRMRLYFAFYPKNASTENVSYSTTAGSNAAIGGQTLFSWTGASRVYAEIIHNDGSPADQGKLHLRDLGGADVTSVETIAWARNDVVEVFVECGAGMTAAKYRINSGAWTALTFAGGGVLGTMAPTGTVNFFWDGISDTNTPAWRVKEIRAYDAGGGPA